MLNMFALSYALSSFFEENKPHNPNLVQLYLGTRAFTHGDGYMMLAEVYLSPAQGDSNIFRKVTRENFLVDADTSVVSISLQELSMEEVQGLAEEGQGWAHGLVTPHPGGGFYPLYQAMSEGRVNFAF